MLREIIYRECADTCDFVNGDSLPKIWLQLRNGTQRGILMLAKRIEIIRSFSTCRDKGELASRSWTA